MNDEPGKIVPPGGARMRQPRRKVKGRGRVNAPEDL